MPGPTPLTVLLLTSLLPIAAAAAQAPAAKAPDAIVLTIALVAPGTDAPRPAADGAPADGSRARTWTGRKLAWRVGDRGAETESAMRLLLQAAAANPENRRPCADRPGTLELLPLRIEPGEDARWGEVVEAFDAAMAAGFAEVYFAGVTTGFLVPKSIDEPILAGGALIVPKAVFNEPDDQPDELRPVFDVHQDGRIEHDGRTLFTWRAGVPDDLGPLRERLLQLRRTFAQRSRLQPRDGDRPERLDVPFLVRADKWAAWRDVLRFVQAATAPEVGFWKFEIAVGEEDHEAKLLRTANDAGR